MSVAARKEAIGEQVKGWIRELRVRIAQTERRVAYRANTPEVLAERLAVQSMQAEIFYYETLLDCANGV